MKLLTLVKRIRSYSRFGTVALKRLHFDVTSNGQLTKSV